ncbi:MAG: hypothetical protein EPGJADBJ_03796 [Saprospiraceae bacterium]|nr:hypothetical protein [Saprospiraceae bacterium]
MQKDNIRQMLERFQTDFDEETLYRRYTLEFLRTCDDFWQRSNLAGHLTGSAWVLNPRRDKALLIHHRALDKWFQPGGHADATDASLAATARREALEECGLGELTLLSEAIFDLDIHVIPAKRDIPEHLHYDVRFAFAAASEMLNGDLSEIRDLQWVPLRELAAAEGVQQSVRRMAVKRGW